MYLKLAEVGPELLEAFLQGDEAGGYLGGSSVPCLHHSLFVEECLQPKFELSRIRQGCRGLMANNAPRPPSAYRMH